MTQPIIKNKIPSIPKSKSKNSVAFKKTHCFINYERRAILSDSVESSNIAIHPISEIRRKSLLQLVNKKCWDKALRIISVSKDAHVLANDKDKDGNYPLHRAIRLHAPDSLVIALVKAFQPAASKANIGKCLPIHMAVFQGSSPAVIEALIRAYPEGLDEKDKFSATPRDWSKKKKLDHSSRSMLERSSAYWSDILLKEALDKNRAYKEKVENLEEEIRSLDEKRNNLENLLNVANFLEEKRKYRHESLLKVELFLEERRRKTICTE